MTTFTDNEDDRCEGFKRVSIEIVQGDEYTINGDKCEDKCSRGLNSDFCHYKKYGTWHADLCTPCTSPGKSLFFFNLCKKMFIIGKAFRFITQ